MFAKQRIIFWRVLCRHKFCTMTTNKVSILKKIALGFGIFLTVFLAAAVAIPYFFKDKIVAKIKEEVNKTIEAKVDFSDVDISLFRSFPELNFRMKDLSVVGKGQFEGINLIHTDALDLTFNVMSVIKGVQPMPIKSVHLEHPNINILALRDGQANYAITKPTTEKEPSNFAMQLNRYSISNGTLTYDDRALDFFMEFKECNHSGKGDFTTDIYDLVTKTDAKSLTMRYGGVTYLNDVRTKGDITVNADMKKFKFTLRDNDVSLNDLRVLCEGWCALPHDDIDMDMKFSAPQNDFKSFLSILPGAYTKEFKDVKATGKFALNGFAKGTYNGATKKNPAFGINFNIENGDVQYPNLPLGIRGINTAVAINSPTSNFDNLTVDIPRFNLKIGNNPFEGRFNLKTPISDPDVDTRINGTLNLAELAKAFPMESISGLEGIIKANVTTQTRLSYIEQKQYERVNMNGTMQIQGMNVKTATMPRVKISDLQMNFTPNFVGIDNFTGQLGKSDMQAKGKIDNILAYFSPTRTMKGDFTFRSNYFDADEWVTPTPANAQPAPQPVSNKAATTSTEEPFSRFDFTLDGQIGNLKYDKYNVLNMISKGHATSNHLDLQEFSAKIGDSDLKANGKIENMFAYLFKNEMLTGVVNMSSSMLNLNQFMTATPAPTGTTPSTTPSEALIIPKNIAMTINADLKKVIYTNMNMDNLTGKIIVKDQKARLENTKMNTMGGVLALAGGYDSSNKDKPTFDFKYDIQNFDFQQSFTTFNSFATLAPLGKYMKGKFNTSLDMKGDVGKDMMPNLATMNAAGFLNTIQAVVDGFEPLKVVGNQLNIDYLKDGVVIKDSKNWFDIVNGAVQVKPFDVKVKDVAMNIFGSHSITNEMNYVIKAKVPRKLLEKNAATSAADKGYNLVTKEASKYGLNVQNGEFVNCQFTITGSAKSPKVAFKLLGSEGQTIQDEVKGQVAQVTKKAEDSLRVVAQKELDKAKDKAKAAADRAADSLKILAQKQLDKAKDKAKEELAKKVGESEAAKKAQEVLGDKAKQAEDKLGGKGKEAVDKAKEAVDKFNPFKKKN